jgi:hypothetical protein
MTAQQFFDYKLLFFFWSGATNNVPQPTSEDAPGTTTVSDQLVRNESCSYNSNINISNNANVYHSSTEGGSSNYNNNNEDNLRQLMEALEFPETSYFFLEDTSLYKELS